MNTLYEMLIPTQFNDGQSTAQEQVAFQNDCLKLAGGYTELGQATGAWKSPDGHVYHDATIPFRVACDAATAHHLAVDAKALFKQEAVILYPVSSGVEFV